MGKKKEEQREALNMTPVLGETNITEWRNYQMFYKGLPQPGPPEDGWSSTPRIPQPTKLTNKIAIIENSHQPKVLMIFLKKQ